VLDSYIGFGAMGSNAGDGRTYVMGSFEVVGCADAWNQQHSDSGSVRLIYRCRDEIDVALTRETVVE
jgi:hypothetical protein